ncbi:amidohydrolase family protein [Enterococcus sp. HY326]|uniref:amidohydrolase family protein n=1 Tax=Enterococcus sp. HY326 TaxID=2971265 RepID=UPI0022402948|nr:amidohydrolase family protein [Enterococcus sp. HY326]
MQLFDSHFHIIEPGFPIIENNGFLPGFYSVADYQTELAAIGLEAVGGAVVSGSFQGFDQSYLEAVLKKFGPNFVGITQLPPETSDAEILRLDAAGVKGIRFNLYRGAAADLKTIEKFSRRVHDLVNWRTEFYLNLDTVSADLEAVILNLPKVSIDHLGMGKANSQRVAKFLAADVAVKVTGFGRVDYSREEIARLLPQLFAENPDRLLFGSDLPGTRARERFTLNDIKLIQDQFSVADAKKILLTNGQNWYL